MRAAARVVFLLAGLLLICPGVAHAKQVIHFKTGFEIVAQQVRYEGEMVILSLEGGSEIGFPRWTIDEIRGEAGVGGGASPDMYNWVKGRGRGDMNHRTRPMVSDEGGPEGERQRTLAQGSTDGIGPRGVNIGFSYSGPQQRFGGKPTWHMTDSGKVGYAPIEEEKKRQEAAKAGGQGAVKGRTLQPEAAKDKDDK